MFDLQRLANLIPGQWERVIATVLLLAAGFVVSQLWAHYLGRGDVPAERRRLHLVWARNVIWSVVLFTIASVWASTIAGFALSLAAVAGAMLIGSKELLLCVRLAYTEKMRLQVGQDIFKATWQALQAASPPPRESA